MVSEKGAVRAVTVYCGSSGLAAAELRKLAREAGRAIAGRGWELVYGGGSVGLMGLIADAALAADGRVTGVITRQLVDFEVAHSGLSTLHVVGSMHERKEVMSRLGDGFLVLPGGFGTLDELFEAISWRQLGLHDKPIVLLNHGGFFDLLVQFLYDSAAAGLVRVPHLDLFHVSDGLTAALDAIADPPVRAASPERWWQDGGEPLRP